VGRIADFPASLPIASCAAGERSSNYATPLALVPDAKSELHVIGVIEGPRGEGDPDQGVGPVYRSVSVAVHARPKPVVLYLSAYESVDWAVTVDAGAALERVILQGYQPQHLTGVPDGVPVTKIGADDALPSFYGWEVGSGGAEYVRAIESIRRRTGLVESSFQGCYTGVTFEVPHWQGQPPACDESLVAGDETVSRRSVAFAGCESITAESQYCLAVVNGGFGLLGIDSGNVCPVAAYAQLYPAVKSDALTWRGQVAYFCDPNAGLVRLSLSNGTTELTQVPCDKVAVDGERLVVAAPWDPEVYVPRSILEFESWEHLLKGRIYGSSEVSAFIERMTVHDGILYTAWHSTNTVDRTLLETGEPLPPLTLEAYDGWILGMAVTSDGRLLVSGDMWGDTVYVFDARTGTSRGVVRPSTPVGGLACVD
jgi:hypothetical protein